MTDRKPQRADAVRNRDRVLATARAAMAAGDLSLQLNELARQAGVGVGTVYRNFPTRQALIEALADDQFEQLLAEVGRALEAADAWAALTRLAGSWVALSLAEPGLAEVMASGSAAGAETAARKGRLGVATEALLARARADGQLRAAVNAEDLWALLCGVVHAATRSSDPMAGGEKYLAVMLNGLQT
ncbi:TetR/AcrR family transcriptional regulator [Crossiella cryophila]|uniref:AcrR family transcriptional regulator n=1 Tax=Crossiella cryophila TaxID=43355 RepID=A0A7W7CG87_9PSEU|nr:TetR/AcrR family transcriptional regulator [Crossiella cryophila]MBB4680680.1 AcrR family transcriptional regulator [Crossiella cryophila]